MKERLQGAALQWIESGRQPRYLLTETAFFLAQCWLYSNGAHQPDGPLFHQDTFDYVEASKAALGGEAGWNSLLNHRAVCSHCAMRYHLENMGICTDCAEYVCPSCKPRHGEKCSGEVVG